MNVRYHPEALKEIDEAFSWYESQAKGFGESFVSEVETAILRLVNFPLLNSTILKDLRRAIVPVFPYGIIYGVSGDQIEVYAIAHLHRKPFYWSKRKM